MGVEVDVIYDGGLRCRATHGPSGDTLPTDAPVDNGGQGAAFSPTDLVGTAMATCMVTIMGKVAEDKGLDIAGTKVHIVKEMITGAKRRIASLNAIITLPPGRTYSAQERAMLENAAATCPVKRSLHPDVNVDIRFEYPD